MNITLFGRNTAVAATVALTTVSLAACSSNVDKGGDIGVSPAEKAAGVHCEGKKVLKASGSTAQQGAIAAFNTIFAKTCPGSAVNYTGSGSGQGVSDFNGGQTDFGGSDSPLKDNEVAAAEKRCHAPAWNLPMVFGPIAVAYHVNGITNLNLSGPTIAKIFNGEIRNWDDTAIAKENPGIKLPNLPILVQFRNDDSGTTDNFQKYLNAASNGAWGKGTGKKFNGGVGTGSKGSDGVSKAISASNGSIGYVEWAYAKTNKLDMANVITSAGPEPVKLSVESARKTIDGVRVKGSGNNLVLDTSSFYKPTTTGSYPIVLATYEIVCSKYTDDNTAQGVKTFLNVALSPQAQSQLEAKGSIPVPEAFKSKLKTAITAIS